jgi:hypothetical protein
MKTFLLAAFIAPFAFIPFNDSEWNCRKHFTAYTHIQAIEFYGMPAETFSAEPGENNTPLKFEFNDASFKQLNNKRTHHFPRDTGDQR